MSGAFTDGAAAAERVLTKLRHDPTAIALTLGAPVIMVVLFGYIFGSAITVPGGGYRAFLIPGLFATIAVNIVPSMFAMARDSSRGVVDRFRSLPIARTAVPFGQAAATAVYGLASFVLMALCGLAVGWRVERGAGYALAALALLAAFQFAATWVGMYLGLVFGSEQAAGQASILIFPVTILSNVYVPTSGMPPLAARHRRLEPGQRAGRRDQGPVRQPASASERDMAARAPGARHAGLDGAAPRRLRAAVYPPLRPHVTARRERRRQVG
jgi:ABC-2 type transport system permease protein